MSLRVFVPPMPLGAVAVDAAPQPHEVLVHTLHRHGLLLDATRVALDANRPVSVTTWAPTHPDVHDGGNGKLMSTASLHIIERNVGLLFPSPPAPVAAGSAAAADAPNAIRRIPVDFLRLTVELMRVVRDVANPLHADASQLLRTVKPVGGGSSTPPAAVPLTHILSRYANRMPRVSAALRVVAAIVDFNEARLSEGDAVLLAQLATDGAFVVAAGSTIPASKRASFDLALARTWIALSSCVRQLCVSPSFASASSTAAQQRNGSGTNNSGNGNPSAAAPANDAVGIGRAALRAFHNDSAWLASGRMLFLAEAYMIALSRVVRVVLFSPAFYLQFDNLPELAAEVAMHRIAQRPPLSTDAATSARCPTLTHAVFFLVRCVRTSLGRVLDDPADRAALAAFRDAVHAHATRLGEDMSVFQWAAYTTICQKRPPGLTLDKDELVARSIRSRLTATGQSVRPELLQAVAGLCIGSAVGGPTGSATAQPADTTMSNDVLLALFDAVSLEVLQLHARTIGEVRGPVLSVNVLRVLAPLEARCGRDLDFYRAVAKRIVHHSEHAYAMVLSASVRRRAEQIPIDEVFALYGHRIANTYLAILQWVPLDMMGPEDAAVALQAVCHLAPMFQVFVLTHMGADASVQKQLTAQLLANEAMATSLTGRLGSQHCIELLKETRALSAQTNMLGNLVFAARLQLFLCCLKSENLCLSVPGDALVEALGDIVLPCLSPAHQPSPLLQHAAHDALIAPVVARVPQALVMIPSYVAIYCPVRGIKAKRPLPALGQVRAFAKKVRLVAESLERMDVATMPAIESGRSEGGPRDAGDTGSPSAAALAVRSVGSTELTPMSAVLLIVQGIFDQVRACFEAHPLAGKNEQARKDAYLSALLNLLQCSNPHITSRVCTSVEVVVLDYLAQRPAEQENALKFIAGVVQQSKNDSIKKPIGEWLLRLTDEVRRRREVGPHGVKVYSKL